MIVTKLTPMLVFASASKDDEQPQLVTVDRFQLDCPVCGHSETSVEKVHHDICFGKCYDEAIRLEHAIRIFDSQDRDR